MKHKSYVAPNPSRRPMLCEKNPIMQRVAAGILLVIASVIMVGAFAALGRMV